MHGLDINYEHLNIVPKIRALDFLSGFEEVTADINYCENDKPHNQRTLHQSSERVL